MELEVSSYTFCNVSFINIFITDFNRPCTAVAALSLRGTLALNSALDYNREPL